MGFTDRLRRLFGSTSVEDYAPEEDRGPHAGRGASMRGNNAKPPPPRRRQRITKIDVDAIDLICEMAKDSHPNEFGASLRAEGDTITEVLLVPASVGGSRHAILPLFNMPIDMSVVGTVHSHPSPAAYPSDADLQLFRQYGHTHIIIAKPYTRTSWRAWDHDGFELRLKIVE